MESDQWVQQKSYRNTLPTFGMDEPTAVGLFPELLIDWAFMQEE